MKRWALRIGTVLALSFLALSFTNASWLADSPRGTPVMIAHRGTGQFFDRTGVTSDTCTATRIEPPMHDLIENTALGLARAQRLGASMVEIDIAPTKDGQIAVFHDWTLDCRTDGTGPVRAKTMAELKQLDIGYGYTADGGKTFPLRGKGMGAMPSLEEVLRALPQTSILFNFKSKDAGEADLLAEALKAAGRDVEAHRDAFYGAPAPVRRIREHFPKAWAWSIDSAQECSWDYVLFGWTGQMPAACTNGTMIVPLDYQWAFWGWPNRLIERMQKVGGRIVVSGPYRSGEPVTGLSLPEELGEIPNTFNGYIWVDDIWTVGPALHPVLDRRTDAEIARAEAGLAARRARQ